MKMKSQRLSLSTMTLAVSVALASMSNAYAQASPPETQQEKAADSTSEESSESDALQLDAIVITGTSTAISKMKQSVSISTLSLESIEQSGATSAAEVLRSIPGVRSESSGGESNANVTTRGVPISAGGGRYVQFQEDGLPILQFGDIQFGTADTFLRVDSMLDRLEVIRGGSASTAATSAPGGIFNFISKTGEEKGGVVGISKGLDYDSTRLDFGYGGDLSEDLRYYVGGFYRSGEGVRNGGVDVEQGGQIRGNVTKSFDGGYIRLSFKHLNDHAPTLLPVPVRYSANGTISTIPGIDPRNASFYSPYWNLDNTLTVNNGRATSNVNDGLTAKTNAFGAEASFDLGNGFQLTDKFRISKNTGRFIGIFPDTNVAAAPAGTTYATGPRAGQAYTGNAFVGVVFNTSIDGLSLLANDLKVSKNFETANGAKIDISAGVYNSTQTIGVTWNFNQYLLEANGDQPALLNSATVINGSAAFGGCCQNFIDADFRTTAPNISFAVESGSWNFDASVRRDQLKATGTVNQTLYIPANSGIRYDAASARQINYKVSNTSYSLGGNYRFNDDVSFFLRYSDGASFNTDRNIFFADARVFNGSNPVPINEVRQTEAGVKYRRGGFSSFVTLFQAKTDESNIDVTTTPIVRTTNSYDAKGIEFEGAYRVGGLKLTAGVTFTDATVTASTNPFLVNKTPRRQADWLYQFGASYDVNQFTFGANLIGTTDSRDDGPPGLGALGVKLPGYNVVNAFGTCRISDKASVSLGVNNLFDKLGFTESNDGRGAARAINGRSSNISLKYSF
jgi:outer membrane receptor protein involved in Fe transport